MSKRVCTAVALAIGLLIVVPPAGAGESSEAVDLQLYRATVDAAKLQQLSEGGHDITLVDQTRKGVEVALVLARPEREALEGEGLDLEVWRDSEGLTQQQRAARQGEGGFEVFDEYDGPGGIKAQVREVAKENRKHTALQKVGTTHEGRQIVGLRVTHNAKKAKPGKRPAVLYQGTAHAREWISTEVTMRLMRYFVEADTKQVRKLLKKTELWFVPVVNPDGYQFTFDEERLWRKNTRDNDEDGEIGFGDGVDLNRNLPEHWNYDDEGSSSLPSSDTYRGPEPASEPETQANMALLDEAKFRFAVSYHSYGQLLLYPQGWQLQTPSADDPIYVALTGTDEDPAVPGFDPDLSAELYTTNGEFTDWAHGTEGVLAWTPELSEGCEGCGFVFPDDEEAVEEEFRNNLRFARNVARSAADPDDPVSHMDIQLEAFYLDLAEIDPYKANNPLADLAVEESYAGGSSQPVEVLAKRAAGKPDLRYRINGGETEVAPTATSPDGETFGGNNGYNRWYRYMRGEIPGLELGDEVEYWFKAGKEKSEHTTFDVTEDADADVLIVAAENRTGAANLPEYASTDPGTPNFLQSYEDAVQAAGFDADVYDVDAKGREAPDHMGVLSHYGAVVWYSGNDLVTREPGWPAGNASRLANDTTLEIRQYLNDGGKLLYTGQWAGALESGVGGAQYYDPVANEQCVVDGELVLERCQLIADKNDFLQYYLGAFLYNSDAGTDPDTGEPRPVTGVADPYEGALWDFNGGDSAQNQVHTASFVNTSSLLKPDEYPQFTSDIPAKWEGVPQAFDPDDGEAYVYSDRADISYKRLARTIDLTEVDPGDAPTVTFSASYDTEPAWDHLFVEAHTVGEDDWTTLPDANGHTTTDVGDSCAEGWHELHPWLARYQGDDCSGANPSAGGEWNATSGRSDGWEEWSIDLSAYAGSEVELSISYASDWSVQGVGAFVDDVQVSTGDGTTSFEDDDDPMDGWEVPGPPEGSSPNANDWTQTASVGFDEGAIVKTADTLYFGFGLEGITGEQTRGEVMEGALGYLLTE